MCKTIEFIDQILQLCDDADKYFKENRAKLKTLEAMQQDVLHLIENDNFNACEGYLYAKKLQDIRKERRLVKNKIETILSFKPEMGDIRKRLEKSKIRASETDAKLIRLMTYKVYKPRVLDKVI